MAVPKPRQVQLREKDSDAAAMTEFKGCDWCGQGNMGVPSICGDPFQNSQSNIKDKYYGIAAEYTEGEEIDISIYVDANHGGRMAVRVCPLDKGEATMECFAKKENHLRRSDTGKAYWYLTNETPRNGATVSKKFKLPAGVSCDKGCMLQWEYIGYQTCQLPCAGEDMDDMESCGGKVMVEGGRNDCPPNGSGAEYFYNCADIIIKSSGGSSVPTIESTPSSKPTNAPASSSANAQTQPTQSVAVQQSSEAPQKTQQSDASQQSSQAPQPTQASDKALVKEMLLKKIEVLTDKINAL
jgi:hypothetical protein